MLSDNKVMFAFLSLQPTVTAHLANYDPLSYPPEDFEMNPHDIDMDAELIPTDPNTSYGFVLCTKGIEANIMNDYTKNTVRKNL